VQPAWEVADVLRRLPLDDLQLNSHQQKTLRAIKACRTAALGGHIDACDECGAIRISYNSCRNRHCPKCQGHKRVEWIQKRGQDLLPCTYYHVVFTLPQELNTLAMRRPDLVYRALFGAAWATLAQFGKHAGVGLGMIAILHTWGQNLSLHPHVHCIVPGGGMDINGYWKKQLSNDKYLFPVKALSKVFRAKYVHCLRQYGITDTELIQSLFQKDWVVYAKRPFGGPRQVIEYLGRYTHKVAISNHRITDVGDTHVRFRYKDYRNGGQVRTMQLMNREFVRRFAQHILPRRFVRIRHYGILSSTWKRGRLRALQHSLHINPAGQPVKTMLRKCPCCKTGTLVTIEIFGTRGPPPHFLRQDQTVPVAG
jgi:hypothetical protein